MLPSNFALILVNLLDPTFAHGFPAVFLDVNFSPRKKKQILVQFHLLPRCEEKSPYRFPFEANFVQDNSRFCSLRAKNIHGLLAGHAHGWIGSLHGWALR